MAHRAPTNPIPISTSRTGRYLGTETATHNWALLAQPMQPLLVLTRISREISSSAKQ